VKSNHYNRQTRRARRCIKVRRPRARAGVDTSRRRVALLVARGSDLAEDAARASAQLELPRELRELLSPASVPTPASVRAGQRVWSDMQRLLIGGALDR
jgi:hypothetical protein